MPKARGILAGVLGAMPLGKMEEEKIDAFWSKHKLGAKVRVYEDFAKRRASEAGHAGKVTRKFFEAADPKPILTPLFNRHKDVPKKERANKVAQDIKDIMKPGARRAQLLVEVYKF